MLSTIITNKTRKKLLLKFFLNKQNTGYLRSLETEFGESTNAIRVELNRMEDAGFLISSFSGNKKYFKANADHPLYNDINSILKKTVGIDKIINDVLLNIGDLQQAYITGDLAMGKDSTIIDLLLIGNSIDKRFVSVLVEKAEHLIHRKIRVLILSDAEKEEYLSNNYALSIWQV